MARGFLGRQRFFAAVRATRGRWPDLAAAPDGLCLDLMESFALSADGDHAAAVFGGVLRTERNAVETLVSQQQQWYANLEDRDHLMARLAILEKPETTELAELTAAFCGWFGRYVSRWLETTHGSEVASGRASNSGLCATSAPCMPALGSSPLQGPRHPTPHDGRVRVLPIDR